MNQNSVVYPLARAKGGFNDIIAQYLEADYGIYQLPCPELRHLGLTRQPMSKEEYDTPSYKTLCQQMAKDVMADLRRYRDDDVNCYLLHGVNQSPTCSITGKRGHFMEALITMLEEERFNLIYDEIPSSYK